MFWFIFCDFTKGEEADNFIDVFDIASNSENKSKTVTLAYFVFTSLSTVGLGDFHPRSNYERFVGAFVLLFGVATTSLIVENIMSMILQMNAHQKSFEQSQQLSLFFGTMERFNEDRPLQPDFIETIEKYFDYRWAHNKNNAIST